MASHRRLLIRSRSYEGTQYIDREPTTPEHPSEKDVRQIVEDKYTNVMEVSQGLLKAFLNIPEVRSSWKRTDECFKYKRFTWQCLSTKDTSTLVNSTMCHPSIGIPIPGVRQAQPSNGLSVTHSSLLLCKRKVASFYIHLSHNPVRDTNDLRILQLIRRVPTNRLGVTWGVQAMALQQVMHPHIPHCLQYAYPNQTTPIPVRNDADS